MPTRLVGKIDKRRFSGGLRHLDRAFIGRTFNQHTGCRIAGLAGIGKTEAGAACHRRVNVGIGENKVRRFAAKLQRHRFHRIGGGLADQDAGAGRSGEGHDIDPRVR